MTVSYADFVTHFVVVSEYVLKCFYVSVSETIFLHSI